MPKNMSQDTPRMVHRENKVNPAQTLKKRGDWLIPPSLERGYGRNGELGLVGAGLNPKHCLTNGVPR